EFSRGVGSVGIIAKRGGRIDGRVLVIGTHRTTRQKQGSAYQGNPRRTFEQFGCVKHHVVLSGEAWPPALLSCAAFGWVRDRASFSMTKNVTGIRQAAIHVAANIPPITTVPMMRRAMAPAPVAAHNGTVPRINAKEVIRMGRNR